MYKNDVIPDVDTESSKKGFTLIELLVVVLIIGILSSVALPQYQKAVQKSRNAQLKTLVRAVADAQKVHYMATGSLASDFGSLDVDLPLSVPAVSAGTGNTCRLITEGPDSIREGKDFHVVLNNSQNRGIGSVSAVWTTGKYKCTGFMIRLLRGDGRVRCMEATFSSVQEGAFCKKIENGKAFETTNLWRMYPIP